jgi:hypothetical protein
VLKTIQRKKLKKKEKIKIKRTEKIKIKKTKELEDKKNFVLMFIRNIHHYFPDLISECSKIKDFRTKPQYKIEEIIFSAIAIFIFKAGSRNSFENFNQGEFAKNFFKAFKIKVPHMDTIDLVMRKIDETELEKLKTYMVRLLIVKKIFYKYKILGNYYNVSVDGTGVMTISEKNIQHYPTALFKTYNKGKKNEKKVYYIFVLEAKLVCESGLCISICTEWIENANKEYEKQDCEIKAFRRLAMKLKKNFPRLPICIVGDGLYPNKTIFKICQDYKWKWIFTLKNGSLKTVWKEVAELLDRQKENTKYSERQIKEKDNSNKIITKSEETFYKWINSIDYEGTIVHWGRAEITVDGEVRHTFVYLTSMEYSYSNVKDIIKNGRLRFKIENEGFNTQKNGGYNLEHKYSETSEKSTKNYYTCLQIGSMINQLIELNSKVKEMLKGRLSIKALWEFIIHFFIFNNIFENMSDDFMHKKYQSRFE